jgi:DeoR/GlpR family transcriptional regulator of sugar metabolism
MLEIERPSFIVDRYKSALHTQLNYHRIQEKKICLNDASRTGQWTPSHQIEYETIDTLITQAMIHAESLAAPTIKRDYE